MNNKKYMNDLKDELNSYTDKLSKLKDSFKGNSKKDFDNIYQSIERILEKAKKSCQDLESASAEEWEPLKKIVVQNFDDLRQSFEESLNNSSKNIKEYAHQFEEFSKEEFGAVSDYIKDNPLKSTLLALALGVIVGKFIK